MTSINPFDILPNVRYNICKYSSVNDGDILIDIDELIEIIDNKEDIGASLADVHVNSCSTYIVILEIKCAWTTFDNNATVITLQELKELSQDNLVEIYIRYE